MQGRCHLPPFEHETGGCSRHLSQSIASASHIIPSVAEPRALRAQVTYEDPTGSFATGGGGATHGNTPSANNGLDWVDDADTNVLQPRHLPHSLITSSELDWDEHDEGSTELWNAPNDVVRGRRGAQPSAAGRPRLPAPTLTPEQARAAQPTAAGPHAPGARYNLPAARVEHAQQGGRLDQTQTTRPTERVPGAAVNGRRGTLPPAQQAAAPSGRRGTLPPAQQLPQRPGAAQPTAARAPVQRAAAQQEPTAVPAGGRGPGPGGRRNTPLGPQPDLTRRAHTPQAAHGLDPALAALDPRRQATLVMHAPPRAPQAPESKVPTLPPPALKLPAAEDLEEDPIEQLQEQLFEAMAKARSEQTRADRAEQRAQQAEARISGLEQLAQHAEADLKAGEERVQHAELEAKRAEARARSSDGRAQQTELRLRQLDGHLRQVEARLHELRARSQEVDELRAHAQDAAALKARVQDAEARAHEAEARAHEAEARAEEAEGQLENLAMAQAQSAPSPQLDGQSEAIMIQLREQLAQAYEHIRVSEVRADEAERRVQAAERRAQSVLHLAEDTEPSRGRKGPSKVSLIQSALLASTLSFGVGAYFALLQPLQKRVQAEAELRTQEAAQHSQAISTLQAQRDSERRGLEAQNQELRAKLEQAHAQIMDTPQPSERRGRHGSASADADDAEPNPTAETRSAKAIERRLRRRARAAHGDGDASEGASDKPASRSAPKSNGGNDPLEGM